MAPYDDQGNWYEDPNKYEPHGPIGSLLAGLGGMFQRGGSSPAQAPAAAPPEAAPDDNEPLTAEQQAALDRQAKEAALDIAIKEEQLRRLQQANGAESSPEAVAKAKAEAEKAQLELERLRGSLTPAQQAQLENDLALARSKVQQDFTAAQDALKHGWDVTENQAQRDFTATQNDLSRGVTLRGQEIERLKAQDDWVMGMLRQQVAEGTLSLQRATNMFNAYIDRARLPSQIMESVSRAVEPFSASIPGKGYVAPGMERGGPYEGLIAAGGGDISTIQRNPFKDLKAVNIQKLAQKAGADFKHTSIPDPGKIFGSVPIPQTNFGDYQSALAGFAPAQYPGSPAAAPPQGPVASVAPPAPDWQMSSDQLDHLNALLDGAQ